MHGYNNCRPIHAIKMKVPMTGLAFIEGKRGKTHSTVSHQIDWPDLPEHNVHVSVKKRKRLDDGRRRLAEYNQTIKPDNSMPSDQIILADDQSKEQIGDAQDRNDGSSELTLRKSSIPSTSSQETSL